MAFIKTANSFYHQLAMHGIVLLFKEDNSYNGKFSLTSKAVIMKMVHCISIHMSISDP